MASRSSFEMKFFRLALFFAAVALYWPMRNHAFVVDDAVYIVENQAVTAGAPLSDYFTNPRTTASRADFCTQSYRPLRTLLFRGIAKVAGLKPIAFRMLGVLLYAICALLVLQLCLKWSGSAVASAWTAALWVLMPVHVEPVVYISALGDHVSLLLELLALNCAMRAARVDAKRPLFDSALSIALIFASMMTKEMAVTEVVLLTGACVFSSVPVERRRAAILVAAHGLATIVFLMLRTKVIGRIGHGDITGHTFLQALREAPVYVMHYVRIILQPLNHSPGYSVGSPSTIQVLLSIAVLVGASVLAWRLKIRAFSFGLIWFVISLLPVLHFVPILAFLADRFALVPTVGVALMLSGLLSRVPESRWKLLHVPAALIAIMFVMSVQLEARAWENDAKLWRYAVELEPTSAQAHSNLGIVLMHEGQFAPALTEFDRSNALGGETALLQLRRGYLLQTLGQPNEAEVAVRRALQIDPNDAAIHSLMGELAARRGDVETAKRELSATENLAPGSSQAEMLRASIAEAEGQWARAVEIYRALEAREPKEARYPALRARAEQHLR